MDALIPRMMIKGSYCIFDQLYMLLPHSWLSSPCWESCWQSCVSSVNSTSTG